MLKSTPPIVPASALNALKDYLRISLSNEDATLLSLLRASLEICENFIGTPALLTHYSEDIIANKCWQKLCKSPVIAIDTIMALSVAGEEIALPIDSYAIDISGAGIGKFRGYNLSGRVRIAYQAGLSESWSDLAEPIRNGIIRLAAHIYSNRNLDESTQPPAAIAALWQPYRRIRLI